ncbi:hybrid sensor histidine kinase/response regulator [Salinispirillum marinum]|uniref:histidine kinase n=2 Tax=Saccharospirillaceae TaxID=255527 RepID=A0ABV8BDR2_9GAMM
MKYTNEIDLQQRLLALESENQRLQRINDALIERVEAGSSMNTTPYAAFEHSTALAEQVRERTAELSELAQRLRLAKQEAEQANHSKTRFLAAVSHDVLQPLNAARLFVGALLEQPATVETAQLIHSVSQALDNIDRLLGTLIDISRLDAGIIQPDITAFDLRALLSQLAMEYQHIAQEGGVTFKAYTPSFTVRSDSVLLGRVLRNFLSNAVRYTPRKGRVVLGCRPCSHAVDIAVWDTGPGIPDDQQAAIFNEFQRLSTGAEHADRGLGLGLAIVDKMARMLDHPVNVHSKLGHGSCFRIRVPRARQQEIVRLTRDDSLVKTERFAWSRVWLIENDVQVAQGMRGLLEAWGCIVVVAHDLANLSAQVNMAQTPVDLLISDYHLDDQVLGIDVINRIQASRAVPVPAMIITADYSRELKEQARAQGIHLVHKPVKPHRLRALMTSLLRP